jgi:3-oxoacyl-[acyl-carrier-protein] synthase-3
LDAFITSLASSLPNAPVDNQSIEDVLGRIDGIPSRTKALILRNNKIKQRHYVIDRATGAITHTNAQLTAEAVRKLAPAGGLDPASIGCLACGTSTPDMLVPGHALMVHGELGLPPLDAVSTHGICLSGITALKYAVMSISLGQVQAAVATGSEIASTFLRSGFFSQMGDDLAVDLDKKPVLGFDADFLRWMLSDGAGAMLVEPLPRPGQLSLKVEWIEHLSFANELPACMTAGAKRAEDGSLVPWRMAGSMDDVARQNMLAVRQDVELLNREIVPTAVNRALERVRQRRGITAEQVNWFLPHYSSDYFRSRLHDAMQLAGFGVPYERWFTNLETKGNTGSASIYIIMDELYHSGRLKPGQNLLCFIPESGRFSIAYMLLKVV